MFDVIVVVDWSANARPKTGRDSIWTCVLDRGDAGVVTTVTNHRTRHAAREYLGAVMHATVGRRVLVGVDFPLGYPVGTAAALGLGDDEPWRAMWRLVASMIHDDGRNGNDRFAVATGLNQRISEGAGPFWGCPPRAASVSLSPRKAPGFPHRLRVSSLAEHRECERRLRSRGSFVFSVWQLLGVGTVGSQTLVGLPVVQALADDDAVATRLVVWPFQTGFTGMPAGGVDGVVVLAEVWPGVVPLEPRHHPVRDAAQVIGLARHLAALDHEGSLGAWFAPLLDADVAHGARREEGWILGVV